MSKLSLVFVVALALCVTALADIGPTGECERYLQGEGTELIIRHDCVLSQGILPIFVRMADDYKGYEIVVPIPQEGDESDLFGAAQAWLADDGNLRDLEQQVGLASSLANLDSSVVDGRISQLEFINYSIGRWLEDSGSAQEIRLVADEIQAQSASPVPGRSVEFLARPGDLETNRPAGCSEIPVCTSCKAYVCGQVGPARNCECKGEGNTCCVIGVDIEDV